MRIIGVIWITLGPSGALNSLNPEELLDFLFAKSNRSRSVVETPKLPIGHEVQAMRMMNEFEAQVLSDLSVLKTQMNGLMGDGNGGRIAELERRMECHEQNWARAKGFMAAISVLFAVIEVAVEAWHRR